MRSPTPRGRPARTTVRTLSVPEAGEEYFGIGRNAAYRAAERGEIPTIRIGKLLRVPRELMERRLLKIDAA